MKTTYTPQGVCSRLMEIETDGETITKVNITGGCNGNLRAISRLVEGMTVGDAVSKLSGIRCGSKTTSCPDQLARALQNLKAK